MDYQEGNQSAGALCCDEAMYGYFQERLSARISNLHKKNVDNSSDIYVHFISFAALIFCLVGHVYFWALYAAWHESTFATINAISIAVYLLLLVLHKGQRFAPVVLMLSFELTCYAAITIHLSGIDSYGAGYFLLAIAFQIMLPYAHARVRTAIALGIFVVSAVCVALSFRAAPSAVFPPDLARIVSVSNIYLVMLGTVAQLSVGNLMRELIDRLNQLKLEQISIMANTDSLTGLYNRRYASQLFSTKSSSISNAYCVAMLDIDDFKQINDTLGHECGDEVLQFLARFLRDNLRKTDYVFRWGGEEFLLLLESSELGVVITVLNKLREKLQVAQIPTSKGCIGITVTIGVSLVPGSVEDGIRNCDDKLYIGKRSGKNMVVS